MIVGLTGGIGSGKTTVAKMFNKLGVPIYVSDIEAKRIMITNDNVISRIQKLLGNDAYINGELNRAFIASKVFDKKELLEQLNKIVHPAVKEDFIQWSKAQETDYVIKESAILFESGSAADCDLVITVTAPMEERINRVVERDNASREEIKKRIENQISDEEKITRSDYVINNILMTETIAQVKNINNSILNKIRKNSSF